MTEIQRGVVLPLYDQDLRSAKKNGKKVTFFLATDVGGHSEECVLANTEVDVVDKFQVKVKLARRDRAVYLWLNKAMIVGTEVL